MNRRIRPSRLAPSVLALVAAAAVAPSVARSPDPLLVERLGRERGFPSETVTALLRDRAGFLWVGSREGLAVWDGYEVRVFEHAVSDPTSLSDDAIRTIHEDRAGRLWVGTDAGGLQLLDRATWRFETFRHDPEDQHSLGHDAVNAIVDGENGAVWVATQNGVDRLDVETRTFEHFGVGDDAATALPNPWVYGLHRDRAGRIWAATVGGGAARLDPATRRITRVPFCPDSGATDRSSLTFSFAEDPHGEIWVGAEDGVFRYDEGSACLERAPIPEIRPGPDTAIVTSIAFDHGGRLWATTWNEGLVGYDPTSGVSRSYRHDPERENGLATDRLSCAIVDSANDVWIGTWGRGIHRFGADTGLFSRIVSQGNDGGGLPQNEIVSVLEDRRARLWVGTWGEGLCWRSGEGKAFSKVAVSSENPGELDTPLSLTEGPDGGMWVGSMAGLYRIGEAGDVERAYRHDPARPGGIARGYVNALAFDGQGRLWVGTGGGGLQRLGPDAGTFVSYRNDPHDPSSLSDDYVTVLRARDDGTIWVGTRAGGLNLFDPSTGLFVRFVPDPNDPRSLGHHTVTSILEDRRGRTWVGTAGGGVARLERGSAGEWRVTRVTIADGLVSSSVVSIQQDDDGSLWIGTRRGLSRYQPETGRFHNYGPGDGLPSLEFRPNASAASRTRLYFGTLGGVVGIARGSEFELPAPTPTLITGIRSLAGPWPVSVPTWETQEIEAAYGTMLSVEFGVLDLRPPHRFAYRLEGEGDGWIDLGGRREITFAGLRPGDYELSVRGLNARGVWSESASPLQMRIVPPFWMTWWFRALLALSVVTLGWTWIHVRFAALERRNRQLEALHRDREAALAQVRESEQALHGAYGRLRSLTRRLEDAKEEERRRIARELHDEMGQALSAVKINLKALGRLSEDTTTSERIGDALSLVDGIIGHVRTLSLDLRPPLLDELGLVVALRGYAEGQSVRAGVDISVEANAEAGDIPAEIAIAAFRIVQESVHNVLRHAPDAHSVTVSVRRDPQRLSVTVRDDGRGFDLAAALERAATGGHLGLLGMRERVEALGGSFEIETEPGRGTAVHAGIPLDDGEVTP